MPAAKEETISGGISLRTKTRVWGVPPSNPNGTGGCRPATATLDWGCPPFYGGTVVDSLDQRYYDSRMGRFLTADPYVASGGAADPKSWNRYAYVKGDPINLRDPAGLFATSCEGCDYIADNGEPTSVPCYILGVPGGGACIVGGSEGGGGGGPASPGGGSDFISTAERRKNRATEIAVALAAIAAKAIKDATAPIPRWPAAIRLADMCGTTDALTGAYKLQVTYEIFDELGTRMRAPDLGGFQIRESFFDITGGLGDLNSSRNAATWSAVNNTIYTNGTFNDLLSAMGTTGGTANQVFTAYGWFGVQPLAILGFGDISGVNENVYSRTSVTVNGKGASKPCAGML